MRVAVGCRGRHAERSGTLGFGEITISDDGDCVEAKEDQAGSAYLDKLAEELTHRGFEAWVMAPPGRVPSVYVVNPAARALEENVYVTRGRDGLWWFWWSWAERISVADDFAAASAAITRVLALPRGRD